MKNIIKEYRKAQSLSQKEMAQLLSITQPTVSNIETNYRQISNKLAIRLHKLDPVAFPFEKTISLKIKNMQYSDLLDLLDLIATMKDVQIDQHEQIVSVKGQIALLSEAISNQAVSYTKS